MSRVCQWGDLRRRGSRIDHCKCTVPTLGTIESRPREGHGHRERAVAAVEQTSMFDEFDLAFPSSVLPAAIRNDPLAGSAKCNFSGLLVRATDGLERR